MTNRSRAGSAVAVLLASSVVAGAQEQPSAEAYRVRAEWRWWKPSLTSQIQKGFGDVQGTLLDLTDDLGVPDEDTWEAHGAIKLSPSFKLLGTYVPIEYVGDTIADSNFFYGGELFFRGEQIVSNFKGSIFGGGVEWDFVRRPSGYFGLIVGARVLLVDSVVLAPEPGRRVVDSETIPVPIFGLGGRAYAGRRFSIAASFAGLTLGSRGHYWEFDVSGRFHLSDRFAGQVGWRRIVVEGEDNRDFVKFLMSGVTFGVEVSL
jgi:hypothetical protein